jgi:long-chain acyl-CoA synthetase
MNNLPEIFLKNSLLFQDKTLFGFKEEGEWQRLSWNNTAQILENLASGLKEIGVKKNDKISIIADNSYQWCIIDLAIISLGGITVPGYTTSNEEELSYLLSHSETSIIFINSKLLPIIEKILPTLNKIKYVVCVDELNTTKKFKFKKLLYTYRELIKIGSKNKNKQNLLRESIKKIKKDDVSCIIYTSGTSSQPKGVMLTHGSILSNIVGANELVKEIKVKDHRFLSIIPLSHAYEHTAGFFLPIYIGAEIYFNDNRDQIVSDLLSVKPTLMTAVPRLYEVLYKKINNQLATQNKVTQKLFYKTVALGTKTFKGFNLSLIEKAENLILDKIVRKKLQRKFGGNLQAFISGGAALNEQVGLFFQSLGINILQGYGQTECSPLISCNPINKIKIDTVGVPIKGLKVKLSKEKEILVRGDSLMKGYWKDKNNTDKVIINGWLHTGDLGFIDDEGYIKISGRINEMIVNSGGENIAPVPIENLLLEHEEIEQAMVYGHNKPFLIALLVPNENLLNSNSNNVQNLTTQFQGIINNINKDLSPTKRIRKFIILEKYFTIDNNMLTPTLKIKRHKIFSNYYNEIQKLYNNSNI